MAKYKRADNSTLSGKLGGLVYKQNANGSYVQPYRRKRGSKVNSQQYVNQFTTLATHWKTLTAAEQQSWENARHWFPKFKKGSGPIILTRKQLYMSHGAVLMQWCGFDIDTLPKMAPTPQPEIGVSRVALLSAQVSSTSLRCNVTYLNGSVNVPADHVLVITASMPVQYVSGEGPSLPCTFFTTLNAGSLAATYNMFFDYQAKFVPLKGNDLIWLEFFTVNVVTGSITQKVRIKIYVQL